MMKSIGVFRNDHGLVRVAARLCLGIAILSGAAAFVHNAAPDFVLDLYTFRQTSGREYGLALLQQFRPLGPVAAAFAAALGWFFWDADRRSLKETSSQIDDVPRQPNAKARSQWRGWPYLLLVLSAIAAAVWLIPLGDGLQDDEGDKLRVAMGSWSNWAEYFFRPRYNILPITVSRFVFLATQTTQEWVLRLPVFLLFGVPLLLMWNRHVRQAFGPLAALFLIVFYGLSGTMGEYASKVQGYLAVLAFATAQFLLWSSMVRARSPGASAPVGLAYVAVSVGAYLSHNFAIVFTAAQFCTSIFLSLVSRRQNAVGLPTAVAAAYGGIALSAVTVLIAVSLRSILLQPIFHAPSQSGTVLGLQSILMATLTGSSEGLGPLAIGIMFTTIVAIQVIRQRVTPELYLGLLTILLISAVYLLVNPGLGVPRYFIWLPLVWFVVAGDTIERTIQSARTLKTRGRFLSYSVLAVLILVSVIPSQLRWQVQRREGPNLNIGGRAAQQLAKEYQERNYSVGYLLLQSAGNYSHRMWFYLPEEDIVSDRSKLGKPLSSLAGDMRRDIWIIPAAYGRFATEYLWIPEAAMRNVSAGNVTVYALSEEQLRQHLAEGVSR